MRWSAICILMLAISEPLLVYAAKVVVVVPQQIRRSPAPSWRSGAPRYRKSSHGGEFHPRYHGPIGQYHVKKSIYPSPPYPHGGDDFDQGHETVNHVRLPYGKDVSHAITFGKGYIPYDHIKGSFSFGRERYPGPPDHEQSEPVYAPTSYYSSGPEYTPGQMYESSHAEAFYSDPESAMSYNDKRNDRKRFYSARSIEKDVTANNPLDYASALNQEKEQLLRLQLKAADFYKTVSLQQQPQQQLQLQPQSQPQPQPQGNVVWASNIPSPTIGGSKEGIVIKDTVSLEEYQQKLQEMTKSWPQYLANGGTALTGGYQTQQVPTTFPAAGQQTSFTGSINWPVNVAQSKQGYAVKEDTNEPPPDFRSMPVQANVFQAFPVSTNNILPTVTQTVHG
ncbi:uncharacterized protein LOC128894776 [Hylaeus anthracinus]|uniref:uncharacterized protein LOC128894776 n=1 Tax=Hylaeus anthracinus TaxID=313031 RepID=UPI0023BA39C2|nr:uncharacterized protein LOC128894776 [Hylaeus anthracinus]